MPQSRVRRTAYPSVRGRGSGVEAGLRAFETVVDFNRSLRDSLGVGFGKVAFFPVHKKLGGRLRLLISGGSAGLSTMMALPRAAPPTLTMAADVVSVNLSILAQARSPSGQRSRRITRHPPLVHLLLLRLPSLLQ